ncbi:hypothetical protein SADUNF_Sadunf12G0108000 [Salix dunnii]|uniref:Uncharacterized protein n=1 Tax=Salix dunnii TaxID=1413687 RepID=A0A835MWD4_9ROSI|nr:hypothetical protein SADUNF_Sadunf12G0108000 [Salix dunnii]
MLFLNSLDRIHIMRIYSPSLPLLVFSTILLALLHSSSCRHISWANYEEKQQINTKYPLPFPQYDLPGVSHTAKSKDDKVSELFGASHMAVPELAQGSELMSAVNKMHYNKSRGTGLMIKENPTLCVVGAHLLRRSSSCLIKIPNYASCSFSPTSLICHWILSLAM